MDETYIQIELTRLRRIARALDGGAEYLHECISRHEKELGRTTRKNRLWAETMDKDLKEITDNIGFLQITLDG